MTATNSMQTGLPGAESKSWKTRLMRLRYLPIFPVFILGLVVFCGIFGPLITPHDPTEGDLFISLMPPFENWDHPLGTDHLGRDILSRIIVGARISLIVGVLVVFFAGSIGAAFGPFISGYIFDLTGSYSRAFIICVFMAVTAIALGAFLKPVRK